MSTAGFHSRPINILMVEDSPADVELTREALADAKLANDLFVVEDGVEALTFVRKQGRYADAPTPDLILLDLNLPRKDGREVLAELKREDGTQRIPVVVLTTSNSDEDILRSYDLNANAFVRKPVDFERFVSVVRSIEQFWLAVVELPSRREP